VREDLIDRHHVAEVDVDVQQVDLVHDLAALADRLAWDDHAEAVGRVAAGGVDAVAGADAGHDQGVDAEGGEDLVEVGTLEGGGVLLGEELLGRPPLEAQLIDLADEIAYNTADLDDGMEARLLTLESLRAELPLFEEFFKPVERRYPAVLPKLQFNEALKAILNHLVTDLMQHSLGEVERHGIASVDQVRDYPSRLIAFSPTVKPHSRLLREYLYKNLYDHPALAPEKEHGVRMIGELFDFYMNDPERLPKGYAEQARESPRHRVVCDYIAGMTDHYLLRQQRGKPGAAGKN